MQHSKKDTLTRLLKTPLWPPSETMKGLTPS